MLQSSSVTGFTVLQGHRVMGSLGYKVTELRGYRVTGSWCVRYDERGGSASLGHHKIQTIDQYALFRIRM